MASSPLSVSVWGHVDMIKVGLFVINLHALCYQCQLCYFTSPIWDDMWWLERQENLFSLLEFTLSVCFGIAPTSLFLELYTWEIQRLSHQHQSPNIEPAQGCMNAFSTDVGTLAIFQGKDYSNILQSLSQHSQSRRPPMCRPLTVASQTVPCKTTLDSVSAVKPSSWEDSSTV